MGETDECDKYLVRGHENEGCRKCGNSDGRRSGRLHRSPVGRQKAYLVLADSESDKTDTLDGLASQQT